MTGGNTNHYATADLLHWAPRRSEFALRAWASSVEPQPEAPATTTTENTKSVHGVAHPALHVPGALSSNVAASGGDREKRSSAGKPRSMGGALSQSWLHHELAIVAGSVCACSSAAGN